MTSDDHERKYFVFDDLSVFLAYRYLRGREKKEK
jgi:hypothetical protein